MPGGTDDCTVCYLVMLCLAAPAQAHPKGQHTCLPHLLQQQSLHHAQHIHERPFGHNMQQSRELTACLM